MIRRSDFRQWLPVVSIGLVEGVIVLFMVISLASLIFSGELAPLAAWGIGLVLLGNFIMQLIVAFTSSMPGVIGAPQDAPAAILSLAALSIAANMTGASLEAKFITMMMTVVLASVLSGLFFVAVGGFNLSRFVRFIPYPVVGGFVAGTGFLLVRGALGVMLGETPAMTELGTLFTSANLLLWLPGFVFGVIVLIVARRSKHILTYPVLLAGAIGVFYLIVGLIGFNLSDLREMGLLLGPFPQGTLWKPPSLSLLAQVDWRMIASQSGNMAVIAFVSIVALLLNASALELIAQKDADLNRELISLGFANIAGGLAGSSVGYHHLAVSSISFRMGISNRLVALFAALVSVVALLAGAAALSLVPKFIVGGLIFFVGFSFLVEWLYDAWHQLPRVDYLMVWAILIVIGWLGFLQGVGVGIVIATALFVVNYSRIGIVKDTLTGRSYRSNMERPFEQIQLIKRMGGCILILRLQGFIFFGTSQSLVNRLNERLKDESQERLRFLILDFQHVSALDASALFSFVRLKQLASANQFHLLFTDINEDLQARLALSGLDEGDAAIRIRPTLDYGMEWCESKLLVEEGGSTIIRAGTLHGQLKRLLPSEEHVERFMSYLERQEQEQHAVLINQGDPPDCMYFIDSGEVTTRLEISEDKFIRLKSQGGGTMIGEMGLFLKQSRTATVVVSEPGVVYRLSLESYDRMMHHDHELAFYLNQWIVRILSVRIAENNSTLEVLLD
ncbi:MAG TPA: SulP family inorganic anion transporter [Anaerolineales bacterium]|nr:SulP family inorganic anion transporter [Anaerolineales bacterium]